MADPLPPLPEPVRKDPQKKTQFYPVSHAAMRVEMCHNRHPACQLYRTNTPRYAFPKI